MKSYIFIIMAGLAFTTSCRKSSYKPIRTPDGNQAIRITCHPDISECWERAGAQCMNGYSIVGQSVHMGGAVADWLPGPVPWYNILVACK